MTGAPPELRGWRRRRWTVVVAAIILVQFGAIFWLARQKPKPGSTPDLPLATAPAMILDKSNAESSALDDPALFVLPNRHGFSGEAWMTIPAQKFSLPEWKEEPRALPLPADQLGADATNYIRPDLAPDVQPASHPDPVMPAILPEVTPLANPSFATFEGDMSKRPLLTSLKLRAWPDMDGAEILNDSVVQIGVDRDGFVFSAVLAAKGKSGSKDADIYALSLARSARFQPLPTVPAYQPPQSESHLQWGRIVFHWQTVPAPATNQAATP